MFNFFFYRMRQRRRDYLGVLPRDLILLHPSGNITISEFYLKVNTISSEFIPKDSFTETNDIDLWLKVNDKIRQQGNTKDMIFK